MQNGSVSATGRRGSTGEAAASAASYVGNSALCPTTTRGSPAARTAGPTTSTRSSAAITARASECSRMNSASAAV